VQFLKFLFWVLIAFVAALFTYANWEPVPIHLWSGLEALVNLPLLLLVTFLLGFLPTHGYHSMMRWRLRQRLAAAEQTLTDTRTLIASSAPAAVTPPAPMPAPSVPSAAFPSPDVPPLPGELA
jgi:hypothetical protein